MSSRNVQQDGPTPRRSVRASTVARSVASQSVVSATAGSSATPSRRKGALPKLTSRQSTAYGATGRITAVEEINVPVTGFAQAFESQRGAAVQRANEDLMSGALSQDGGDDKSVNARSQNAEEYLSEDPPSDEESAEEEDQSVANTSKSFGMMREAGMLQNLSPPRVPGSTPAVRRTTARTGILPPREPQSARREPVRLEPARLQPRVAPTPVRPLAQPPIRAAPREEQRQPEAKSFQFEFKKDWLRYGLYGLLALWFLLFLSKPGNLGAIRSGLGKFAPSLAPSFPGEPTAEDPTEQSMIDWVRGNDKRLGDEIHSLEGTVHRLYDNLPKYVVVTKSRDGSLKIDDEFWNALVKKMKSKGLGGNTAEDWEAWMIKNKGKVAEVFNQSFDANKAHPHVVKREEFTKMVEKNWHDLSQLVDKKITEVYKTMDTKIKSAVSKEVRQIMVDKVRLESLAMTNLLVNMEINLQKPNYFSSGLGAGIDTTHSSPTAHSTRTFMQLITSKILPPAERRPPAIALERWDEVGDCWCAAPSTSGHGLAQLSINLASRIFPSHLTIEHVPMTMVPAKNIASAPKNVELWVKSDQPAQPRFRSYGACKSADDMPEGWICLGAVTYDIFGSNHVQTFELPAESPVAVDKAIVRVTENYGADRTCLYRVRLHGAYDGPDYEYASGE